jgi:hypothetical protein
MVSLVKLGYHILCSPRIFPSPNAALPGSARATPIVCFRGWVGGKGGGNTHDQFLQVRLAAVTGQKTSKMWQRFGFF